MRKDIKLIMNPSNHSGVLVELMSPELMFLGVDASIQVTVDLTARGGIQSRTSFGTLDVTPPILKV
jgi:hypothetical protein